MYPLCLNVFPRACSDCSCLVWTTPVLSDLLCCEFKLASVLGVFFEGVQWTKLNELLESSLAGKDTPRRARTSEWSWTVSTWWRIPDTCWDLFDLKTRHVYIRVAPIAKIHWSECGVHCFSPRLSMRQQTARDRSVKNTCLRSVKWRRSASLSSFGCWADGSSFADIQYRIPWCRTRAHTNRYHNVQCTTPVKSAFVHAPITSSELLHWILGIQTRFLINTVWI